MALLSLTLSAVLVALATGCACYTLACLILDDDGPDEEELP